MHWWWVMSAESLSGVLVLGLQEMPVRWQISHNNDVWWPGTCVCATSY